MDLKIIKPRCLYNLRGSELTFLGYHSLPGECRPRVIRVGFNGIEVIVNVEEYGKGDTDFGGGINYLNGPNGKEMIDKKTRT